ncbi:hypothetical protein Lal_00005911, partial [Lupinus albus]
NFIWSGDVKVKNLVTVAWHKVCIPIKEGGLGLISLKEINHAALLKLSWKMQTCSHDWTVFFRNKFVTDNRPSSAYIKSSIWPGIKSNCQRILDNWIGVSLVDSLNIPNHMHPSLSAKVVDFIYNSHWIILDWLYRNQPSICAAIVRNQIPIMDKPDKLVLVNSSDGELSLKDAYTFIKPTGSPLNWCKLI